jgi:hypothetical protein
MSSLVDSLIGLLVLLVILVVVLLAVFVVLRIGLFVADLFDQKQGERENKQWQEFDATWRTEMEKHWKEYLEACGKARSRTVDPNGR